jgi:hypothetical protein
VPVAVAVGVISFTLGRALTVRKPVATAMPAKVVEPEMVLGIEAHLGNVD